MRALLHSIVQAIRTVWLLVGISLALLVVVERISARWLDRTTGDAVDSRAHADGYHGADWVDAYFHEFAQANRVAWQSYVYWRRQPFAGRYINIDAEGVRKTWNAPAAGAEVPRRIFIFGGSTMWGTGARDDYTIASFLSRMIATQSSRVPVEITNFAEGGYVGTQELILLMRELQRGHVPDVAIFFDGVNDVFSAFQSGTPGIPQNEFNRVREFNIDVDGRIYREAIGTLVRQSAMQALAGGTGASHQMVAPDWDSSAEKLGDDTLRLYRSTVDMIRRLAKAYNFRVLFYWQPVIFTKTHLTAYEQAEADRQAGLRDFYVSVYDKLRQQSAAASIHDLGSLFSDDPEPYFIDFCHLTEAGNQRIAQVMLNDVLAVAREVPAAP